MVTERLTVAGLLCGMLISWPLWRSERGYPRVPAFGVWSPAAPLDVVWSMLFLGVAGWLAVRGPSRAAVAILIALAAWWCAADQSRLQPWFWQYVWMLAVLGLRSPDDEASARRALVGCALIVAGTYFWSGWQKFNGGFVYDTFPWLMAPFTGGHPVSGPRLSAAGWLAGPIEASAGLALSIPRCRPVAVVSHPTTDRWRERTAPVVVLVVGLGHRAWLLWRSRAALAALWADNPDTYQSHNAPIGMLRDHLGITLLYLQQTPPMSNLILGMMVRVLPWPFATTLGLIAMQGLITTITAVLLQRLLLDLFPGRVVLTTLVALAFVFDTDVLVIEYNTFGQLFSETLGMLLVLAVAISLLRTWRTGRPRDAAATGMLTGLLALTRATWTVFLLPGAPFVALLAPRRRLAVTLAFLAPIVLLQGGWLMKNGLVHGRWVTTSWGGFSPLHGLALLGEGEQFVAFVDERATPPWLPAVLRGDADALPGELGARDAELAARFGVENWSTNSARAAELFAAIEDNFFAYARRHPDRIARNALRGYALFWQPIANFGHMFLAPYCTAARTPTAFDVGGLVRLGLAGELPEPLLRVEGPFLRRRFHPVTVGALTWLDPLRLVATAVGVHLLAPIALLAAFVRWRRGRLGRAPGLAARRAMALLVCGAMYAYVAALSSVVDYGENMRFRLGVEPLIWVLTIVGAAGCLDLWRARGTAPGDAVSDAVSAPAGRPVVEGRPGRRGRRPAPGPGRCPA